jgi:uncharacterized protein
VRIAVVGAGISGLTAARLLEAENEITVFESEDRPGGHTHTVDVEVAGERHAVDTGFIVMNEENYPEFSRLLGKLGVATQPTTMSFSVRCDRTGIEYNGSSLRQLFAQRLNLLRPGFLRMLLDILRFFREAPDVLAAEGETETVSGWVGSRKYGRMFLPFFLEPLGASLWSCPPGTFREFPMRFVVDFLANHRMLKRTGRPQWRVVRGGSRNYLVPLVRPFRDRLRLRCPVRRVLRTDDGVRIATDAGEEVFDEAVIACHADQALRMLGDPSAAERKVLGAFPYLDNTVTLHTDPAVLPRRRRAWGSWNFHRPAEERDRTTVTYCMTILQSLATETVFNVTLNEDEAIDPSRVLRRFAYAHPVYSRGRAAAQARHGELIRARRTSFCGAYFGYGFHEDGVRSARRVAEAFGRSLDDV